MDSSENVTQLLVKWGEGDKAALERLTPCARMAKSEQAKASIATLASMNKRNFIDPYLLATIYAGLGDKQEAFAWLEKAYEAKSAFLSSAKAEPKFDVLRDDPRFAKLLQRVGFAG